MRVGDPVEDAPPVVFLPPGTGVIVGLVAAVRLTRFMSSLVGILLIAVAFVASFLPASRASRTDPVVALRFE